MKTHYSDTVFGKNIGNKGVTLTLIGKMVIISQLWRVLLIFIFDEKIKLAN